MPDDTQTGGQAPAGEQPQGGNAAHDQTQGAQAQTSSQQPQPGAQGQQGEQQNQQQQQHASADELRQRLERMEKELADTRKEAANYRTKAKDLDKRIADEEAAKLSDVEKAQKRAEAAEAAMKTSRARIAKAELKVAAKDAGIIDPDDAVAHLGGKIEFDDEGEPKNVADLVKELKASKPHLFASAASAASAQRTANTGAAMNAARSATQSGAGLTREIIERMTPREHAQRRSEVMAWLAAHSNG